MYVCVYVRIKVYMYLCVCVCVCARARVCVCVTLIYIIKEGVCVCGSRNTAENKDGGLKFWQSLQVDKRMCYAKYNQNWSSGTR
jgi:hypothetical protein